MAEEALVLLRTLDLNKINLRERRQMLTQGISMWLTIRKRGRVIYYYHKILGKL